MFSLDCWGGEVRTMCGFERILGVVLCGKEGKSGADRVERLEI
jgi:hypothetical protein